ncbi:MAG: hypothetical protein HY763_00415 [Planctomycetes bacterium]|nr:hypothetical protein [Planctomycetota bacterium]
MSGIPTIPGVPSASLGASIGPQGISLTASLTLDKCNARPIFVYVVPTDGNVWRIVDPLSPTEKLPVMKEWTKEKKKKRGHWEEETIPGETPPQPPGGETPPPERSYQCLKRDVAGAWFKFDRPTTISDAANESVFEPVTRAALDGVLNEVENMVTTGTPDGSGEPLPATASYWVVLFGHADMCNTFVYNRGLSERRVHAVGHRLLPRSKAAVLDIAGYCGDFNPVSPDSPNAHELASERSAADFATTPNPEKGNETNRRVELFVIPDYSPGNYPPEMPAGNLFKIFKDTREAVLAELAAARASDPAIPDVSEEWIPGLPPCTKGIQMCHKLCDPFSSTFGGERPNTALLLRRHRRLNAAGEPEAFGPQYRQCRFYREFQRQVQRTICIPTERRQPPPPPPPPPTPTPPITRRKWVDDPPETVVEGEYHPPDGEHYGYFMNKMVGPPAVETAGPLVAPEVNVAPNERVNPDDFNLIKPGPIQVVKMDIGFWGDEREEDLARQTGFRRVPARYFGMIEGQFVFLCFFETPDNAGFVKACSETFDEKLTPLSARLAQAVRDAGFKILIMAKAVAEDGPNPRQLHVLFPDMHLPRKFDERDPVYATDECLHRVHMVKSMVLHQLKRDYRLPAEKTPWLSNEDRQMCRDFFERPFDAARPRRLKLPHWSSGRKMSNPISPEGSGLSAVVDATKKAYQALMQVGYYLFEFTEDDYRRMVKKYPENFVEKGYGRTKDALFNWFYGFETDRNVPPPQRSGIGEELKSMTPLIIREGVDEVSRWSGKIPDTNLSPDPGTKPAQELRERIDPLPARDLLRFLDVIEQQNRRRGGYIRVFQTGDLYELWANRRFLFEDFDFTDDPAPQMTDLTEGLMPGSMDTTGQSPLQAVGTVLGEVGKFLGRNFFKLMLGGINAVETDLWFRREANKRTPEGEMGPESSFTLRSVDNDFSFPEFSAPSSGVGISANNMRTPTVRYDNPQNMMFDKSAERGKGYLSAETRRRMAEVAAFEAPLRDDPDGNREDTALLGTANIRRRRNQPPLGLWNRAVVEKFGRVRTTFIYGNHDCFRGNPRQGGIGEALPYFSTPGLWIEHGHRFEDSNVDGQPFGAFITNLAFEMQELAFKEGLLDEIALHREQDLFQPGILQWFILVEFGLATKADFQNPPEDVPAIHRFRISVNSHTHVPDLVVANLVFKERESSNLFSIGPINIGLQDVINGGGAILKAVLFHKKIAEWFKQWDERHGWKKWGEDIMGQLINWGVDFAGLAKCLDKAADFLKRNTDQARRRLEDEWNKSRRTGKQAIDDNFRNLGLPPP